MFRAFAYQSYRKSKKREVRYFAYLIGEDDIADGLSVGLTPKAAVKGLAENFGYCSISAGTVHALPFNLEVRVDVDDQNHAFICNLPLMTISDQSRDQAIFIARELARRSTCVTCNPYKPNGETANMEG